MTSGVYIRTKENKENLRQSILKYYETPEAIKKNRQGQLKRFSNILEIENVRKVQLKNFQEHPERREKQRQSMIKKFEDPNVREKCRQANIKRFQDPIEREKLKLIRLRRFHMFSALDKFITQKYCPLFNDELKKSVRSRDSHICQNCGITQDEHLKKSKQLLHVHHIHYDKTNCYPDLITLCVSCNAKANKNRPYWEQLYMNKLNDRQLLFWTKSRKNIL